MNLLVISERFWPEGGGGTLATYLITKLLASCGDFKVTVITGTPNPTKINNVSFIIDETFRIPYKPIRWLHFLRPSVKKYYKDLMKEFDIIYIPYAYPLIPLAKELNKKTIVHLHDYQPIAYNSTILYNQQNGLINDIKTEFMYELLEHDSIKRAIAGSLAVPITTLCKSWVSKADVIICVSRRQAEIISKKASELVRKIRVVYNPLPDVPLITKNLKDPVFLYLGGDSYVKGFYILLRSSIQLLKKYNLIFLFTKDFNRRNKLLLNSLNKKFKGVYRLLGHIKYSEVLKLHSVSYALLFSSIWEELLPYAVIESMLAGTIPIASRIGGVPEIVEGTYAEKMMFTPGDSNELADKMEEVLSLSREQLVNIGHELREAVLKRFNTNITKQEFLKVFKA